MPSANRTSFQEKLCLHFWDNEEELKQHFSSPEISRLLRLRDLDREVLMNPTQPSNKYVNWLRSKYRISERQAQYDLQDLKIAVGAFSINDKEYKKRNLSEGLLRMMALSEERNDPGGFAKNAKIYAAINRLDKDDPVPVDKNMVPLSARPTMDAKYLNAKYENPDILKRMQEEAEKRWAKRLVEEAEYEDVPQSTDIDPFDKSKMDIDKRPPKNESD